MNPSALSTFDLRVACCCLTCATGFASANHRDGCGTCNYGLLLVNEPVVASHTGGACGTQNLNVDNAVVAQLTFGKILPRDF